MQRLPQSKPTADDLVRMRIHGIRRRPGPMQADR
jgi:hypothetical protein